MTAEEDKRYNEYWNNVKTSKGMLDDCNKAILKYNEFGEYYEFKLKFERRVKWGTETLDMDETGFNIKASRLQKLSDSNKLYKITPNRDPSITRSYKNAIIKAVKISIKRI